MTHEVWLVLGGVLLSMAGQLLTLLIHDHAARALGEPPVGAHRSLLPILWPIGLALLLGGLALMSVLRHLASRPPDDDAEP